MNKLERLMQDEDGTLYRDDGDLLSKDDAILVGKITTLVVANPCIDISRMIDEMTERKSVFIPKDANAYVASDFSGDTQHLRKIGGYEKWYAVFAVQFYYANNS